MTVLITVENMKSKDSEVSHTGAICFGQDKTVYEGESGKNIKDWPFPTAQSMRATHESLTNDKSQKLEQDNDTRNAGEHLTLK